MHTFTPKELLVVMSFFFGKEKTAIYSSRKMGIVVSSIGQV